MKIEYRIQHDDKLISRPLDTLIHLHTYILILILSLHQEEGYVPHLHMENNNKQLHTEKLEYSLLSMRQAFKHYNY